MASRVAARTNAMYVNVAIRRGVGLGCRDCYLLVSCGGSVGLEGAKRCSPKAVLGSPTSPGDDRTIHSFDADMSFPVEVPKRQRSRRHASASPRGEPADHTEISVAIVSAVGEKVLGRVHVDYRNLLAGGGAGTTRDFWVPVERQARVFSGALHMGVSVTSYPVPVPREVAQPSAETANQRGDAAKWIEISPWTVAAKRAGPAGGTTAADAVAAARAVAAQFDQSGWGSAPLSKGYQEEPRAHTRAHGPPLWGKGSSKVTPSTSGTGTPRTSRDGFEPSVHSAPAADSYHHQYPPSSPWGESSPGRPPRSSSRPGTPGRFVRSAAVSEGLGAADWRAELERMQIKRAVAFGATHEEAGLYGPGAAPAAAGSPLPPRVARGFDRERVGCFTCFGAS
eukprot:tig00000331_g24147.t1